MKIHGTISMEISDAEVSRIFNERLDVLCGGRDIFMKVDGTVWEEQSGGHNGYTEQVEKPTQMQVAALHFRASLRKLDRER